MGKQTGQSVNSATDRNFASTIQSSLSVDEHRMRGNETFVKRSVGDEFGRRISILKNASARKSEVSEAVRR
jgi:hypothetical protein